METQTTQTTETVGAPVEATATEPVTVPLSSGESEAEPAVSVAVDGVEVAVTDSKEELELTPVSGVVGVLVLGLVAVVVARLRKK